MTPSRNIFFETAQKPLPPDPKAIIEPNASHATEHGAGDGIAMHEEAEYVSRAPDSHRKAPVPAAS